MDAHRNRKPSCRWNQVVSETDFEGGMDGLPIAFATLDYKACPLSLFLGSKWYLHGCLPSESGTGSHNLQRFVFFSTQWLIVMLRKMEQFCSLRHWVSDTKHKWPKMVRGSPGSPSHVLQLVFHFYPFNFSNSGKLFFFLNMIFYYLSDKIGIDSLEIL
jgi:hypothetical protein